MLVPRLSAFRLSQGHIVLLHYSLRSAGGLEVSHQQIAALLLLSAQYDTPSIQRNSKLIPKSGPTESNNPFRQQT